MQKILASILVQAALAASSSAQQYIVQATSSATYQLTGFNASGTGTAIAGGYQSIPSLPGVGTVNYANNFTASPTYSGRAIDAQTQTLNDDVFLLTDGTAADNSTKGNAFPIGDYSLTAPTTTSLIATFTIQFSYQIALSRNNAPPRPDGTYLLDFRIQPYINTPSNLAANFDLPIGGTFDYASGTVITGTRTLSATVFVPRGQTYILATTNQLSFQASIPPPQATPEPASLIALGVGAMELLRRRKRP